MKKKTITLLLSSIGGHPELSGTICVPSLLLKKYENEYPNCTIIEAKPAYDSEKEAEDAYCYINELFVRIIDSVYGDLNKYHDVNLSKKNWMLLLGQWLISYLFHQYSIYQQVIKNLESFSNINTIGYSYNENMINVDTYDATNYMRSDHSYIDGVARVVDFLGHSGCVSYIKKIKKTSAYRKNWCNKVKSYITRLIIYLYSRITSHFSSVLHYRSGFSLMEQLKLFPFSGFKVARLFFYAPYVNIERNDTRKYQRHDIMSFDATNEFEEYINKRISKDLPICFSEGFAAYFKIAKKLSRLHSKVKKIFTSTAIYFDEVFKFFFVLMEGRGCELITAPHGGRSGVDFLVWNDNFEKNIASTWYSWGWESRDKKIKPMPATLLMRYRQKYKFRKNKFKILYCTTDIPQNIISLPLEINYYSSYMNWQRQFLNALSSNILNDLVIRPHREDSGWNMKAHLQSSVDSKITFEGWDKPFPKSLHESLLYIGDHCSTTYVIALAINVPTVLYWDTKFIKHTDHADIEIQKLKNVGIFHDSPECAAKHINSIIHNVYDWWLSDEVQSAKNSFCYKYARTDKNALKLWKNELLS